MLESALLPAVWVTDWTLCRSLESAIRVSRLSVKGNFVRDLIGLCQAWEGS